MTARLAGVTGIAKLDALPASHDFNTVRLSIRASSMKREDAMTVSTRLSARLQVSFLIAVTGMSACTFDSSRRDLSKCTSSRAIGDKVGFVGYCVRSSILSKASLLHAVWSDGFVVTVDSSANEGKGRLAWGHASRELVGPTMVAAAAEEAMSCFSGHAYGTPGSGLSSIYVHTPNSLVHFHWDEKVLPAYGANMRVSAEYEAFASLWIRMKIRAVRCAGQAINEQTFDDPLPAELHNRTGRRTAQELCELSWISELEFSESGQPTQ